MGFRLDIFTTDIIPGIGGLPYQQLGELGRPFVNYLSFEPIAKMCAFLQLVTKPKPPCSMDKSLQSIPMNKP